MSDASFALQAAAENLLAKALHALRDGDEPRARRLAERALALPFDDHEGVVPAWWAVSMLVDDVVVDEMEDSEPDDDAWLTACEEVLATLQGAPADAVRCALAVAVSDHDLPAREARRARAASGGASPDALLLRELREPGEDVDALLGVLRAVLSYEVLLAAVRARRG
ncbi:hypothetical protein CLV92_10915 [Kineococcus xinjiangensis]|uniref:Uncharacterized protein n=2 Tax=Kineococcus xinjiangensis TaxID=512762 RepID=A0A2S6IHP9_9ACTN|nr:hypothetical protein CLV92_10915 [Kineococcus xinjiangensis]